MYIYIRTKWIRLIPGVTYSVKGDDEQGGQKGKGKVKVFIIV